MRQDMHKLFFEKGRTSGRRGVSRCNVSEQDFEFAARRESMTADYPDWANKGRIFQVRALRRFLASRVGQPWDQVYSEITGTLKGPRFAEMLEYVADWVAVGAYFDSAGQLVCNTACRGVQLVSRESLYFPHPVTGLLTKTQRGPHRQSLVEPPPWNGRGSTSQVQHLSDSQQLHCFQGIWYAVTLAPVNFENPGKGLSFEKDAVTKHALGESSSAHTMAVLYEKTGVYATSKEQLSRKELERFGLLNLPRS